MITSAVPYLEGGVNSYYLWYVRDRDSHTFNLDAVRDQNVAYPGQKKNGRPRCNPLGKNPTNVWEIPKVTSGRNRSSRERADHITNAFILFLGIRGRNRSSRERADHPAQFPLAVLDRIIRASSDCGDLVFDPFIGSGRAVSTERPDLIAGAAKAVRGAGGKTRLLCGTGMSQGRMLPRQ